MTKIGCIRLVWEGDKKYKFSFLLCEGPLSWSNEGGGVGIAEAGYEKKILPLHPFQNPVNAPDCFDCF